MAYSLVQQNSYCISGFQRKSIDFHQSKKFTQSQIVRKVTCVNSQSFCPSLWYDRRSHILFRCHFETSTLSCSIFGVLIRWIDGQLVVKETQVSTDLFGRGIDIERVNIVINYDMPDESIQAALGVADQLIRQTVMQETHRTWIWLKVRWKT